MDQHLQNVQKLYMLGKKCDLYANHLTQLLLKGLVKPSVVSLREHLPQCYEVLWQGNPISTAKTFKMDMCALMCP